jgi:predicted ester cyclase
MSPEELKAHARRIPEELLTQGDLAVADELLAPGCLHHTPIPLAPGREDMKRWVSAFRRAFPDLRAIVEDEIAEGDTVVLRLTLSGTHEGEFLGVLPTERPVTWQVMTIQRIGPDGKIAEHWSSWDQLGLLRQLSALPAVAGVWGKARASRGGSA